MSRLIWLPARARVLLVVCWDCCTLQPFVLPYGGSLASASHGTGLPSYITRKVTLSSILSKEFDAVDDPAHPYDPLCFGAVLDLAYKSVALLAVRHGARNAEVLLSFAARMYATSLEDEISSCGLP